MRKLLGVTLGISTVLLAACGGTPDESLNATSNTATASSEIQQAAKEKLLFHPSVTVLSTRNGMIKLPSLANNTSNNSALASLLENIPNNVSNAFNSLPANPHPWWTLIPKPVPKSPSPAQNSSGSTPTNFSTDPQSSPDSQQQQQQMAVNLVNMLMQQYGLTKNQAIGVVASLMEESGLNTGIEQGGSYTTNPSLQGDVVNQTGYGLAQWGESRKQGLLDYASSHNLPPSSQAAQVGFMMQELNGSYSHVVSDMKNGPDDASAACKTWTTEYEEASDPNMSGRLANISQIQSWVNSAPPPSPSPSTGELDPGKAPGGNFSLSGFKLELPTGSSGNIDTIDGSQLAAGYTNKYYFYTDPNDGSMVMMDPRTGWTFSESLHPRTELRENNMWATNGTNIMDATVKVTQVPNNTTIGQIFQGTGPSKPLCELQVTSGGTVNLLIENTNQGGNTNEHKVGTVSIGEKFTYELRLQGTTITVKINNSTTTFTMDSSFDGEKFFFKAGNYDQSATSGVPQTTVGTVVKFYSLHITH